MFGNAEVRRGCLAFARFLRQFRGAAEKTTRRRMAELSRIFRWIWIPTAVLACAFLARVNIWLIERVESDSQLFASNPALDPSSPTGLAHAQRDLIVPERNEDSLHWIMQTQQMLSQHEWRVRHVDYDNAPQGRNVSAPSPYRWWLGAVAWADHAISGRAVGLAVTHAALYTDPLLQGIALLLITGFVAYAFSGFSATWFALGFATLFPLATLFQPGAPDDRGLAAIAALSDLLVVLWALRATTPGSRRRWIVAGLVGGLNLWISVQTGVPVLLGIFFGGAAFSLLGARSSAGDAHALEGAPAWRMWSYAGASATLVAWVAEYFPGHCANWNIEFVHPLYALAWLGLGEILAQLIRANSPRKPLRTALFCALGLTAIAPIVVIMAKGDTRGFLAVDLLAQRLTKLPNSPVAASVRVWLLHEGFSAAFVFAVLPAFVALIAIAAAFQLRLDRDGRACIILGTLVVALGFAWNELTFWSAVNAVALAALTILSPGIANGARRWSWAVALALVVAAVGGTKLAWPGPDARAGATLTAASAQLLIERDLAHWLAQRMADVPPGEKPSVVLASPRVTMSQSFYGNLHGIGTVNTDNRGGLGATIAIVSATTMEEAQTLMAQRNVKYLVIPSWDPFFEDYTHLYLAKNFANWHPFFIPQLRQWHLPAWLRPIPYEMPPIGGYETQSVLIFEIVPDQNPAVAASRLGEYFIESGRTSDLVWADDALRRFPGDVGALAARAQIAAARSDDVTYQQIMTTLIPRLRAGGDRFLLWDRRVSVAIALARGGQQDLARAQVQHCIQDLDLAKARSLSTGFLYNLLVVANALHIEINNPALKQAVLKLLPPELRPQVAHD